MRWPTPSPAHAASPSAISSGVPRSAGVSDDGSCGAGLREVDVDADGHLDACRIAAGLLERPLQLGTDAGIAVVRSSVPGLVPGVGVANGQPQHPRALGGDEDRQLRPGRREEDGVVDRMEASTVVGSARPDQLADDRQRILEPPDLVVGG